MFDWIVSLVERGGYFGVAALMFAENVFPPIPSELIMPLAGFSAARGELNLFAVIIAGTVGSLLGVLVWYYIGRALGAARLKRWAARHGRWLSLSTEEVDRSNDWFLRHGGCAVFIGRLVPAVRTLISVPAGIAEMSVTKFLLYSSIGTFVWTTFLAGTGYLLESRYDQVSSYMNPISNIVVGALLLGYIYRVVTFGGRET